MDFWRHSARISKREKKRDEIIKKNECSKLNYEFNKNNNNWYGMDTLKVLEMKGYQKKKL